MLTQLRAGHRGADLEAAGRACDLTGRRDPLDVDHQVGLDEAGSQPHQKIGAAGQHIGAALFLCQQSRGLFQACRTFVSHGSSFMRARTPSQIGDAGNVITFPRRSAVSCSPLDSRRQSNARLWSSISRGKDKETTPTGLLTSSLITRKRWPLGTVERGPFRTRIQGKPAR